MLGEDHSLLAEFPEFKDHIERLMKEDQDFQSSAEQYNTLDAEIRRLELANSPASDGTMRQMKHDRAVLKDRLYRQLEAL